jgi:hypothetical protein
MECEDSVDSRGVPREKTAARSLLWSGVVTSKRRKSIRASSSKRGASSPQLTEIRGEFQSAIAKLKALGCEDSMILVEFWHALDCVNGDDCADV